MLELPYDFPHQPPKGFTYEVLPFKRNLIAIWCCNHSKFTYNDGAVAKSIWGFYNTKKQCYLAPVTSIKQGAEVDVDNTTPYSAMQLNLNPLERAFL
jgi:hypothetical protein